MSDMRRNDGRPPPSGNAGASSHPKPAETAREGARDATAAEQARVAAGTLRDEAAAVLSDTKAEAADVVNETRERAESFAEEQKSAGARHAEGIARAVHRAADELQDSAPQFASYVREAGDAASSLARNMRERSLGSLAGDIQEMARRQPVAFFGAAVLAGLAISRFIKSSSEGDQHGQDDRERPQHGSWHRDDNHRSDADQDPVGSTRAPVPAVGSGSPATGPSSSGVATSGTGGTTAAQTSSPPGASSPGTMALGAQR